MDDRTEQARKPPDGPRSDPGAYGEAYAEALARLADRPGSLAGRTPERWAELGGILMVDDPVDFGERVASAPGFADGDR